jgi:hypothetical protein
LGKDGAGSEVAYVVPFLKPQHFYEARHRYVYSTMAALFERAAAIDYHTIAEELERQGTYEPAGGLGYLSELNLSTPCPQLPSWPQPIGTLCSTSGDARAPALDHVTGTRRGVQGEQQHRVERPVRNDAA